MGLHRLPMVLYSLGDRDGIRPIPVLSRTQHIGSMECVVAAPEPGTVVAPVLYSVDSWSADIIRRPLICFRSSPVHFELLIHLRCVMHVLLPTFPCSLR